MNRKITTLVSLVTATVLLLTSCGKKDLRAEVFKKIDDLQQLVDRAESKGINTLKERTTIRTAEIFSTYADWDEQNVDLNTSYFAISQYYTQDSIELGKNLPDFERKQMCDMLDAAAAELRSVIDGKTYRLDTPDVDWSKTEIVGDAITFEGKPVFLADWTWKPRTKLYTEYHGNEGIFSISANQIINEQGDLDPRFKNTLEQKPTGTMGFIFMGHNQVPRWAKEKDPKIEEGAGIKYTMYDISNPLAREMQHNLIKSVVPMMAGKNYTKLGYMLCNEPHWNTIKGAWAANEISDYACEDFKKWLKAKHKTISQLNKIWGTNYISFATIDTPKIMEEDMRGSSLYFDFLSFNMDRVTEWFKFLDGEVKRYDSEALTHIKLIVNLWSGTRRDSGIDLEALTANTDIIGNDAGSCGAKLFGARGSWEDYYSFNWHELFMAQDFMTSVSPNKVMYNTESHFLSTVHFRDLYMSKEYVRLNYWMAHVHGLSVSQTWYWARAEDGSYCKGDSAGKDYAGSNNHQPAVVNEVHTTMADLNSISDHIMAFQRQAKDIRLFYTKASSINLERYMEDELGTYESLLFDGMPIGFATNNIIREQDNDQWKIIVVASTPHMFNEDVVQLQRYLDNGGSVIIDSESMLYDEYGNPLKATLKSSKGELIKVSNAEEAAARALTIAEGSSFYPDVVVAQDNGTEQDCAVWRVLKCDDGSYLLNICNLGNRAANITITGKDGSPVKSVSEVLTGRERRSTIEMPIYGLEVLKVVL
ncbi:MAG: alpha-amylase family protein [Rikenellaceae bacterium]